VTQDAVERTLVASKAFAPLVQRLGGGFRCGCQAWRCEFAEESKKKANSATLRPSRVVSTAYPHLALKKVIFQIRDKAG
jgi:hypothetical protein